MSALGKCVAAASGFGENAIDAVLTGTRREGPVSVLTFLVSPGREVTVVRPAGSLSPVQPGAAFALAWPGDAALVFPA